jgi:gliding motility-associated lipoprotein GldD
VSKKRGYFRITFPEKKYQVFERPGYPYTFEYPVYSNVIKDSTFFEDKAEDWWINIDFPQFAGRVYISYKPLGTGRYTFDSLVEDAFEMSQKKHVDISTGISERRIETPQGGGIYFRLAGNTATANQFFITDSTKHFLRGALYFDAAPNSDSLSIVNEFLRQDLEHLINTLKWK